MRLPDQETVSIPPDGRPAQEQPRWRNDFPIDIPQDEHVSRREFTKFMALVSLSFFAGQIWIVFQNLYRRSRGQQPIQEIASISGIPVGGAQLFNYPAEHSPCLLLRTAENSFVAFSQKCTHLSCPVIPDMQQNQLRCPCHEGYFDAATGAPLAGPPRRKLPKIHLKIAGGKIYATGVEEVT